MTDMPAPPILPRRRGGGPSMRRAAGEAGVIKTNDDAQATKLSCASLGYFNDAILPLLHKSLPSRKPPIINRGTWARHAVMRQITSDFVTACATGSSASGGAGPLSSSDSSTWLQPVCQVVALGAGNDSSWFNSRHQGWPLLPAAHFIELDYQEVVSKKARTVLSTAALLQLLPEGTTAATAPVPIGQAAPAAVPPATAAPTSIAVSSQTGGVSAASSADGAAHQPAVTWTKQAAAPATDTQQQPDCSTSSASIQQPSPQQQQQEQGSSGAAVHHAGQTAMAADGCSSSMQQPGCSSSVAAVDHHCGPQPPAAVLHHVQELTGQQYSLVAADLRDQQQLKAALTRAGFKARLPTLFLCECVLIYLDPAEAEAVLSTAAALAAEAGAAAAMAIYEQTRPDDAFGSTMIRNLEARGCPLRSVLSVPTPAAQAQRLQATGWASAAAADMAAIYYASSSSTTQSTSGNSSSLQLPARQVPPLAGAAPAAAGVDAADASAADDDAGSGWLRPSWQVERQRIEGLELLDELEEWKLLQGHYCLALGVLGDGPDAWLSEALQLSRLAALG